MYEVVGKKRVDFKPKGSDDKIDGLTLYVTYEEDKVQGLATDKIFLSTTKFGDMFSDLQVGTLIEISYNKFGKVDGVKIAAV